MNSSQEARSMMLHTLHLQNYKCFEDQTLELNALTLLSGLNGTGKSSIIQSLLLLRQSYQQNLLQTTGLALNGDLVHIGTAKDALFENAREDIIGFDLKLGNGATEGSWYFNYDRKVDVLGLSPLKASTQANSQSAETIYDASLFKSNFQYLQAERIGPRRFFETSDFLVRQHRQLGSAGEYTAQFLDTFRNENITSKLLSHPEAVSLALKDQVEAWLGEISPGTRLTLTPNLDADTINMQYSFVTGNQDSNKYRATNVGFGITYGLPILVAALSSKIRRLICIREDRQRWESS